MLEKAQENLGMQNMGSPGLEAAKVQLSELVSKVSNECIGNAFHGLEGIPSLNNLQVHQPQLADCSLDSCLTSCEGIPRKDQGMANFQRGLRTLNGNLLTCTHNINPQPAWCYSNEHNKTSFSVKIQREGVVVAADQATLKERFDDDDDNMFCEHPNSSERHAYAAENGVKQSTSCGMASHIAQLDLNADEEDNEGDIDSKFDLNGFTWS